MGVNISIAGSPHDIFIFPEKKCKLSSWSKINGQVSRIGFGSKWVEQILVTHKIQIKTLTLPKAIFLHFFICLIFGSCICHLCYFKNNNIYYQKGPDVIFQPLMHFSFLSILILVVCDNYIHVT